jgi:hypothetical protein
MNDFDYDLFEDMEQVSPMYDDAYMPDTNLWYEEEGEDEGMKVTELLELCIEPTLRDGVSHVGTLLLWCFLFRASTQIGVITYFLAIVLVDDIPITVFKIPLIVH